MQPSKNLLFKIMPPLMNSDIYLTRVFELPGCFDPKDRRFDFNIIKSVGANPSYRGPIKFDDENYLCSMITNHLAGSTETCAPYSIRIQFSDEWKELDRKFWPAEIKEMINHIIEAKMTIEKNMRGAVIE